MVERHKQRNARFRGGNLERKVKHPQTVAIKKERTKEGGWETVGRRTGHTARTVKIR